MYKVSNIEGLNRFSALFARFADFGADKADFSALFTRFADFGSDKAGFSALFARYANFGSDKAGFSALADFCPITTHASCSLPAHPFYLNTGSLNCSSFVRESESTCAWRLLPCESIVTIAAKPSVCICHIASGIPNSSKKCTPFTFLKHLA